MVGEGADADLVHGLCHGVALLPREAVDDARLPAKILQDQLPDGFGHRLPTLLVAHLVLQVAPVEAREEPLRSLHSKLVQHV